MVLAVGAVFAAGCSSHASNGGTNTSSAASLIEAASAKTQDAGSARMSLDVSVSGMPTSSGTGSFTEHGQGAFDFGNKEGQLTLSIPQLGSTSITILFTSEALYERVPSSFGGAITGGKPWLKVDLSALGNLASTNPSLGASSDPAQVLNSLLGASNDVRKVGTDTVRGTSTTHYHLTLDLTKAASKLPASARSSFLQGLSALGSTKVPSDVWVDGDGRLRRLTLQFAISPQQGAGTGGTIHLAETIELYDFGVAVHVTPPPASQVADVSSALGGGSSGSGSGTTSPSP